MCGRYVSPSERSMEDYFHIGRHNWEGWVQRFNVAPTTPVPIVYQPQGERMGDIARWGLVPHWWKQEKLPALTFNARSEEAARKPTWRDSLRQQRCLMPARGWYEWNENETVPTTRGRTSYQPYFFHDPNAEVLAIAGLWSLWQAPSGSTLLSCALLTREADAEHLASIHHRMPVVLRPDQFDAWLAVDTAADTVAGLIAESRNDFVAHRVSTKVNNARNEAPELIEEYPHE